MPIRYYQGRRIFFRPVELADEPLLRQWINDPANWKTLSRWLPANEVREREYIEGLYKTPDSVVLGIVVRQDDRLIGTIGLVQIDPVNRNAVFGILVGDREYQGRGYGTEATRLMVRYGFAELNLNRIGLTVYADNQRAIRAYRRAGFVKEGRRRQAFYRSGSYHDELAFGILRSEWPGESGEAAVADEVEQTADAEEVEAAEGSDGQDADLPVAGLGSMSTWNMGVLS